MTQNTTIANTITPAIIEPKDARPVGIKDARPVGIKD
jgi:hypothetical protein